MTIVWATKLRGFLRYTINAFDWMQDDFCYYETNSKIHTLKAKIVKNKILDLFGYFRINKIEERTDCSEYASYNRFLKSDKPYIIYLENPTALYHYALNRIKYPLGKRRFLNCLNDTNLKSIIFMSKICEETFEEINCKIPKTITTETIYPLVPNNKYIDKQIIKTKSHRNKLELLFSAQGARFVSKGGLEVIEAIKQCKNVHLTIVTKINDVNETIIDRIKANKNITLLDFTLSHDELEKLYANTNILIHPSSDDSCPLTVLEATKGGCAVIASRLYAIPEMVENGVNGILVDPKYWFFDKNGIPNPKVWNHRNSTIYSTKTSDIIIRKLIDNITYLEKNRDVLEKYSTNSYTRSIDNNLFGEEGIKKKWEKVLL